MSDFQERLGSLSDAQRLRVESVIKAAIDEELVAERIGGAASAANFSRGLVFSRVTQQAVSDKVILPALQEMDDEQFDKFTNRIASLRRAGEGN